MMTIKKAGRSWAPVLAAILLFAPELKGQTGSGPYLGQTPPGKTAEAFAPWLEASGSSGFLRDGTVFVFGTYQPGSDWRFAPNYWMELRDGAWSEPEITPWSEFLPYNYTVGPAGQTVYFTSLKSPDLTTAQLGENGNIWAVSFHDSGWTEPVMLGPSINTGEYYENYPSVAANGAIYYMSRREEGVGRTDIWMSPNLDGRYGEAVNLGEPINSAESDQDPFIAPDESYLIVCLRGRDDSLGEYDLYVSFRNEEGEWSEPVNLGEGVNTDGYEFRPYVTPDGRYLFFTSNGWSGDGSGGVYWVDAGVIADLKRAPRPEDGSGGR